MKDLIRPVEENNILKYETRNQYNERVLINQNQSPIEDLEPLNLLKMKFPKYTKQFKDNLKGSYQLFNGYRESNKKYSESSRL